MALTGDGPVVNPHGDGDVNEAPNQVANQVPNQVPDPPPLNPFLPNAPVTPVPLRPQLN